MNIQFEDNMISTVIPFINLIEVTLKKIKADLNK